MDPVILDTESNARPDDSLFCYTYNHFVQTQIQETYNVSHKLEHLLVFLNGMLQDTSSYTEDEFTFYFDTQVLQDTFIGRNHFSVLNTLILSLEETLPFTRETVDIQRKKIVKFREPVEDYHLIYNNGVLLSRSDYKISNDTIELPMRLTGRIDVIRFTKDILGIDYPKLQRESVFTQSEAELEIEKTTMPQGFELFSNGFILPKFIVEDTFNDNKQDFSFEITPELITLYTPLQLGTQLDFVQFNKECDANNPNVDEEVDNTDYVGIDVDPELFVPDFGEGDWRPRGRDELEEDPDLNKRKFIVRLKDNSNTILANSQIVSIRTMDKFVALDKILTTPIISGNIVTINNRNFFNRTINTFTRSLSSLSGTQEVCPEDPVLLRITGSRKGIVFGGGKNSPYSADSDYNTAAVHSGLVKVGQKTILKRIEIRYYKMESRSDRAFIGSVQNGVKSFDRVEGCGFYLVDSSDTSTCQNPADAVDDYATYYVDAYTKTSTGKFFKGNYVKELNFSKTNTGIINGWYQDYLGRSPDQEGFAFFNKASETTHANNLPGLKQVFIQQAEAEILKQGKTIATFTYCQFQCLAFCDAPPTKKDINAVYSTEMILIGTKGNIRRNYSLVKQPLTAIGKTINDWFLETLGRNADRTNFNKFIAASTGVQLSALRTAFDNAIQSELNTYGKTLAVYTTCEYKCIQLTVASNNLTATLRYFNANTKNEYIGDRAPVNEGQRVLYKLETTGVPPNKNISYKITGIDINDLSEGTLTGEFVQTGTNGKAFNVRGNKQFYQDVFITIKEDFRTEGVEELVLTLGTPFNSISKTLVITDSSAPNISLFITNNNTGKILTGDPIEIIEGDTLRFSLRTTGVPLGGKIGYSLSSPQSIFGDRRLQSHDLVATHAPPTTVGTSLVYNGEFTQSLVFGDYFLSDIVTYQAAEDQITDGVKFYNFTINSSTYFPDVNISANVRILDTSRAFGLCATVYRDVYTPDLVANIKLLDGLVPQTRYTEYANPLWAPFGINTAVEFTGYFIPPKSGPITFTAETDNLVRIWINNIYSSDPLFTITNAIINTTSSQSNTVTLDKNVPYPIRIQYANHQELSYFKLSYQVGAETVSTNFDGLVSKFNLFDPAPYNTCVTALAPGLCRYIYFDKDLSSLSTLELGYPTKSEIDLGNPMKLSNTTSAATLFPITTDPLVVIWNGILRLPTGSTAGNYTFGITGVDDVIAIWIGERAINLGTADLLKRTKLSDAIFTHTNKDTPQEFTIHLEPGRNYPFKMLYVNTIGTPNFNFGIKTGGTFSTDLSNYFYNYGTCLFCGLSGGDNTFSFYGPSNLPSTAPDAPGGRIHDNGYIKYTINGLGHGVLGKGLAKPGVRWDPTGTGVFPDLGYFDDYLTPGNPFETGLFKVTKGGSTKFIGGSNSVPIAGGNTPCAQYSIGVNRTLISYNDTGFGKVTMEYNTEPGEAIIRMKMKYKNTTTESVTVQALRMFDPDAGGWTNTLEKGFPAGPIPATDIISTIGPNGDPMSIYTPGNGYTHNTGMHTWSDSYSGFDNVINMTLGGRTLSPDGDWNIAAAWDIGTVTPGQEVFVTVYYIISGSIATTEKLIWGCISPPQNTGIPGLCRAIRTDNITGLIIEKTNAAAPYYPVKLPREESGKPYIRNYETPEGSYVVIDTGKFIPTTTDTYTFTSFNAVGSFYMWLGFPDAEASAPINLTTANIKNVNGTGTLTFTRSVKRDSVYDIKLVYISPVNGVPSGGIGANLKYGSSTIPETENFAGTWFNPECLGDLATFTLTTSSTEVQEDSAYSFSVVTNTVVPVGTDMYWEFDGLNIIDINVSIGTYAVTSVSTGVDPNFDLSPDLLGDLVNVLYLKNLGRHPENTGAVDGRVNDIIAGTKTLEQVATDIFNSAESNTYKTGPGSRRKGILPVSAGRNDTVNFMVVRDYRAEGDEQGTLLIRTTSHAGPIVSSANIKIIDTSVLYANIGSVDKVVDIVNTFSYSFVGVFSPSYVGKIIQISTEPATDPAPVLPYTDLSSADITITPSSHTISSTHVTAFKFDLTVSGSHADNKAFKIIAKIDTDTVATTGNIVLDASILPPPPPTTAPPTTAPPTTAPPPTGGPGLVRQTLSNGSFLIEEEIDGPILHGIRSNASPTGYIYDFNQGEYTQMWTGNFVPTTTEDHTFYCDSVDDAAALFVGYHAVPGNPYAIGDANLVVTLGGTNTYTMPMITGQPYPIRVLYTQITGPHIFSFEYSTPTITRTNDFTGKIFNNGKTGTVATASITPSVTAVNEGGPFSFTVDTINYPAGRTLWWWFDGVSSIDFNNQPGTYQDWDPSFNPTVTNNTTSNIAPVSYAGLVNLIYLKHLGRYPESTAVGPRVVDLAGGNKTLEQVDSETYNSTEADSYRTTITRRGGSFVTDGSGTNTVTGVIIFDSKLEGPETANILIRTESIQGPIVANVDVVINDTASIHGDMFPVPWDLSPGYVHTMSFVSLGDRFNGEPFVIKVSPPDSGLPAISGTDITITNGTWTQPSTQTHVQTFTVKVNDGYTSSDPYVYFKLGAHVGVAESLFTGTGNIRVVTGGTFTGPLAVWGIDRSDGGPALVEDTPSSNYYQVPEGRTIKLYLFIHPTHPDFTPGMTVDWELRDQNIGGSLTASDFTPSALTGTMKIETLYPYMPGGYYEGNVEVTATADMIAEGSGSEGAIIKATSPSAFTHPTVNELAFRIMDTGGSAPCNLVTGQSFGVHNDSYPSPGTGGGMNFRLSDNGRWSVQGSTSIDSGAWYTGANNGDPALADAYECRVTALTLNASIGSTQVFVFGQTFYTNGTLQGGATLPTSWETIVLQQVIALSVGSQTQQMEVSVTATIEIRKVGDASCSTSREVSLYLSKDMAT